MLSTLSFHKLVRVRRMLEAWGIRITDEARKHIREDEGMMENVRKLFKEVNGKMFREMDKVCPWLLKDKEACGAASAAYIGCQIFKGVLKLKESNDDLDTPLILIYLISDFIMDDKTAPLKIKKQLKDVFDNNPEDFINSDLDDKVRAVLDQYMILTTASPNSKNALLKTWHYEVECEKQKSNESTLDELWDMTYEKGALTTLMAYATMMNVDPVTDCNVIDAVRMMGGITQLLDDLMDHQTDLDEGINTAALVAIKNNKLDEYVYCVLLRIGMLPDHLLFMKVFFTQILCSCAGHNMGCSDEVRELLLDNCVSKKRYNLVEFVESMQSVN